MVRRGRKRYRKDSQKGPRGGKTRQEVTRQKVRRHNRKLREKGLKQVKFVSLPHSGGPTARYGVYRDGSEWVLTGMSAAEYREKTASDARGGSTLETQSRHVLLGYDGYPDPAKGVEIDRFETKSAALRYVSADASTRVEAGVYVVCDEHDPRVRREEIDKTAVREFQRRASRVRP